MAGQARTPQEVGERNAFQAEELQSDLNVQATLDRLRINRAKFDKMSKHEQDLELWITYLNSGRPDEVTEILGDKNVWNTGVRINKDPRQLPREQRHHQLRITHDFS